MPAEDAGDRILWKVNGNEKKKFWNMSITRHTPELL